MDAVGRGASRGDLQTGDIDDWFATGGSEYEDLVTEGLAPVTHERIAPAREEDLVHRKRMRRRANL